jgi:hypothetical protein
MITVNDLENAALAVGMKSVRMSDDGSGLCAYGLQDVWRPHTDPGHAGRLAVKMRMCVDIQGGRDDGMVIAFIDHKHPRMETQGVSHDGTYADAERAYCEAITLCAAAEGKRMKEGSAK